MPATIYWQYSQALPWLLAILLAVALVLHWLYRPQFSGIRGTVQWALPLLRLTAMAILLLSVLRPVLSRPRSDLERGPLVVLLDNSRSMGVVDTGRPVGQAVAIAAALRRLPGSIRDIDLQAMQDKCDRLANLADDVARVRAERDYAKLSGVSVDAANTRLDQAVHDLQTIAHAAAAQAARFAHGANLERTLTYLGGVPAGTDRDLWLDRIGDRSRTAAAEAEKDRIANDAALYRSDVRVADECEPLQAMSRFELCQTVLNDPHAGLLARLGSALPVAVYDVGDQLTPTAPKSAAVVDGDRTNLTGGIRSALASVGNTPIRAIVLFSDGRQIDADAQTSGTGGVPVFTVAAAARAGLKDVTISDVSMPDSAFVGETVAVHVQVRGFGVNGQSSTVTFDADGEQQSKTVNFVDDRPLPIDFSWVIKASGPQRFTVEASSLPDEITLENNHVERWIKVFDRKCRIAIAAGTDEPDIRIIRRAVAQAPWAELGLISIASSGAIPWSPAEIAPCDVVLLSGLRSNMFTAVQINAFSELVRERGASLILLPDENGSFGDRGTQLSTLLPFARSGETGWRTWPTERGGFQVGPSPGVHVLDFGDSSDAFWQALPPLSRYIPITPLKPAVRPLLVESESGTPVLTECRLGRGRLFCMGMNETWRWRASNTEFPERFWRQFLRYTGGQQYEVRDGGVCLDAEPIIAMPKQPVRLRVRVMSGRRDPAAVTLHLLRNENISREVLLAPVEPRGGGMFETTMTDLAEGNYEVRADAGAGLGHPMLTLRIHASGEAEMSDLTGDDGWLRRLAESSGGQFFRLDQVAQLPDKIRNLPVDLAHPVEFRLWDGPYLFGIVLGCFAIEWGLRKRLGLM